MESPPVRSAAKASCCCTRALVKCMQRAERSVRRGIHLDWKVAWQRGEGGGQVASRVCSPLDGVFPDNAPKSGVIYVGEISCIPSYLHQLRKTGGGNFATADRYVLNHPHKYFKRSNGCGYVQGKVN